tara:strand:+ start:108 stop:512 length:405 start_codon:yes stop_codon:yes gene_type:complete
MGYIEKTLSGDEKVEYKFSFHWIVWVLPIFFILFGFTLMYIPTLYGVYKILVIIFTEQGVTSKKSLKKTGIISRNTEELFLSKTETVEIKQGILGRILGYGNVQLTGTGNSFLTFKVVSNPLKVKRDIESLLNI